MIFEEFHNYFREKYGKSNFLPTFNVENLLSYDYYDTERTLSKYIDIYLDILSPFMGSSADSTQKNNEANLLNPRAVIQMMNPIYPMDQEYQKSKMSQMNSLNPMNQMSQMYPRKKFKNKDGITFSRVYANFELLKDIELKSFSSLINQSHLSKDKDALIENYLFRIEETIKERQLDLDEASIATDLLEKISKIDNNSSHFSNTLSTTRAGGGNFSVDANVLNEMIVRDSRLSLTSKIFQARVNAATKQVEIERLQKIVNEEQSTEVDQNKIKSANESIIQLAKLIESRVNQANKLDEEYLSKEVEGAVSLTGPVSFVVESDSKKTIIIICVSAFMLALFFSFFHDYWRRSNRENKE
ncbi:MAG: hypothetical protein HQK84_02690 [Nitrospinae bacterium]|nr:hypothetical protein [Nitrospinota bacterium]